MIRLLPILALLALTSCTFQPGVSLDMIPEADLEACEHLNQEMGIALTAPATGSSLPSVDKPHARYDIGLAQEDGRYVGKVLYNSSVDADYVLFFDQDVKLEVLDSDLHGIGIEESASSSVACGSVKARYVVHMGIGPHTLLLGPTAASTVSLVIEETAHGAHEEEHDHDHAH